MISRRHFVGFTTVFASLAKLSCADDSIDGFVARVQKSAQGVTRPYRLFIPPQYDSQKKKYPLVLWLHGAGSVGSDNRKQVTLDSIQGTHVWITMANQMKYPAFVVAPQCPPGRTWNTSGELSVVLEVLDSLQKEFSIDSRRLYVSGQSMGGYGTWELIAEKPVLFAAAVPLCGGGNVATAGSISKVPIWAFHGSADRVVSVNESRKMITAIKNAGGNPRYTEYPGVGHEVWLHAFNEPGLIDWLFAQHR